LLAFFILFTFVEGGVFGIFATTPKLYILHIFINYSLALALGIWLVIVFMTFHSSWPYCWTKGLRRSSSTDLELQAQGVTKETREKGSSSDEASNESADGRHSGVVAPGVDLEDETKSSSGDTTATEE